MCGDNSSRRYVGEASVQRGFQDLTLSSNIVPSVVSHKFKRKSFNENGGAEEKIERGVSSGCLGFHGRGGGCKVGVDTSDDFDQGCGKRKSNEEAKVDCFLYERIWKRKWKKDKVVEEPCEVFLPDEILEMCLVRLPLRTLMTARLVCKKWRTLTSGNRFIQIRREHQKPWLFLFGVVKDGYCSGHIHVLDTSFDRWHKIDASVLKGRFMFSVATVGDEVFVVGGCSSLNHFGKFDKTSFRTHKGVLVFNPLARSWRKVAAMKAARSAAVIGVFEVNSGSAVCQSHRDRCFPRTRMGGVSDVYEDPHRLSLRRRQDGDDVYASVEHMKQENSMSNPSGGSRFGLIVVGGLGSWDEPLDSGEIYDPVSNKWIDIGKAPGDFGIVCSGTVCKGFFYVYSETDNLAAYDLHKCVWFRIQTAQSPPRLREYCPKLLSCNTRLLMFSVSWCDLDGCREKAVRKAWELDTTQLTWKEISRHPDAPMDWNPAFVESRGQVFGIEMFKIFGQVLDFFTVCNSSDLRLQWSRVSRKHVAHQLDASSCITKSLAVLHM